MIGRKPITSTPSTTLNEFAKGLSRGTDTLQQGLGSATQYLGDKIGSDTLKDFGQEVAERNAREAMDPNNAAAVGSWEDVDGFGSAAKYVASNVGSSLPYMAPMALTGGIGSVLGASAKGIQALSAVGLAPSMLGETYQQALENGYSDDDLGMLATATGKTLLNFMPVGRAMSLLTGKGKFIKGLPLTAGIEGVTEASEEMLDANLRAQHDADFDMWSPEQKRQYTESMIAGATVGGTTHVASAGLGTVSKAVNTGMNAAKEGQRIIEDQRPAEYKIEDAAQEVLTTGELSADSKSMITQMGMNWQEFEEGVRITQIENQQRKMNGQETGPAYQPNPEARQQSIDYMTEQQSYPGNEERIADIVFGEEITPEQQQAEEYTKAGMQSELPVNQQEIGPEGSALGRMEYENEQNTQAAKGADISGEGDDGTTITDTKSGLDNQSGAGSTFYESAEKATRIKESLDKIIKAAGLQDEISTEVGQDAYDAIKDRDVPVDVLQSDVFDPADPETTKNARKLTIKNKSDGAVADTTPIRALRDSYREEEIVDNSDSMGPKKSYKSSFDEETFVKSRARDFEGSRDPEGDARSELARLTKDDKNISEQAESFVPQAEQLIKGLQNETTRNSKNSITEIHKLQQKDVTKLRQQGFNIHNKFTGGKNAKGTPLSISDLKRLSMQAYMQDKYPNKPIKLNKELRDRAAEAMGELKGSMTSKAVLAEFTPTSSGNTIRLGPKESWQDYLSAEEKQDVITRADGKTANMTPFERQLLGVKSDQVNRVKGTVTTDNARWVTAIKSDEASGDGRWEMGTPETRGVSPVTTVGGVNDVQATADRIDDIQANDPEELSFGDFLIGPEANASIMSAKDYQKYLIEGLNSYGLTDIVTRIKSIGLSTDKNTMFNQQETIQIADAIEASNKAEKAEYMLDEGVADKKLNEETQGKGKTKFTSEELAVKDAKVSERKAEAGKYESGPIVKIPKVVYKKSARSKLSTDEKRAKKAEEEAKKLASEINKEIADNTTGDVLPGDNKQVLDKTEKELRELLSMPAKLRILNDRKKEEARIAREVADVKADAEMLKWLIDKDKTTEANLIEGIAILEKAKKLPMDQAKVLVNARKELKVTSTRIENLEERLQDARSKLPRKPLGATVEQESTMRDNKKPKAKKSAVRSKPADVKVAGEGKGKGGNKGKVGDGDSIGNRSFTSGEQFEVIVDNKVSKGQMLVVQPKSGSDAKIKVFVNFDNRDIDDNVLLDSYNLGLGTAEGGAHANTFKAVIGRPGYASFSAKLPDDSRYNYIGMTGGNPDHNARVLKAIKYSSATFKATNDYGDSFRVEKTNAGKYVVHGSLRELHSMSNTGIIANVILGVLRTEGSMSQNATTPEEHANIRKMAEKIRFENETIIGSYDYYDPYKSLINQSQNKMTDEKFSTIFAGIKFLEAKEDYYYPELRRDPDGNQILVASKDKIMSMSYLAVSDLYANLQDELIAARVNSLIQHNRNNESIDRNKFITDDIEQTFYNYEGQKKTVTIQENSEATVYQEVLDTLHLEQAKLLQMHQEYNTDAVDNPANNKKIQGQDIKPLIEKRKELDRLVRKIEQERRRVLQENNIADERQEAIKQAANEHKVNVYVNANLEGYSSFTNTWDMNVHTILSSNQKSQDRDTKEYLESIGQSKMVRKQSGVKGEISQEEYNVAKGQLKGVLDFNALDKGSQDQKIRDVALVNRSEALFVSSPLKSRRVGGSAKYAVAVALKQKKPVYATNGEHMFQLNEIGLAEKHRFVPPHKNMAFLGGIANNPVSNRAAQAMLDKYVHFSAAVNNGRYLTEQLGSSFNDVKGQKKIMYNPETNRYSGNPYDLGKKTLEDLLNMRPASEAKKVLNKYKYRFIPEVLDKGTVTDYIYGDTSYTLKIDPRTKVVRGNARILEALNTAGMEKFIEKAHKAYIDSPADVSKTQTFEVNIRGALHDKSYNINIVPDSDTAIKTPTKQSHAAEKKRRNQGRPGEMSVGEVKDWYKYWTNGKDHREITDVINTATKDMPFKVSVMTPKEAHVFYKADKEAHGERDDFKERYETKNLGGYATPRVDKNGNYRIFVHPQFDGKLRDIVAQHELGHIVKYDLWNSSDSRTKNAIFAEFEKFREDYGKDNDSVHELLRKKKNSIEAENLISIMGRDKTLGDLEPKAAEYYRDFDEWFADQTAMAYVSNQETANSNIVKKFFREFVKMLKQLMGKNQVEKYIDSLNNGNYETKKKV